MKLTLTLTCLLVCSLAMAQFNPTTIQQNQGSPVTKIHNAGSAKIDSNLTVMIDSLFSSVDTIVLTGTSVTFGTGANSQAQCYASLLAATFGMIPLNEGIAGMSLSKPPGYGGLSFMNVYTTFIPPKRPHLKYLVLEWGENDSFFQFTGAGAFTKAGFITDYTTVLNYALSQGWTPSNIIMTAPEWQLTSRCPKINQDSFYNATLQLATSFGLRIADDYISEQNINGADKVDGVHPSNFGHARKAYSISQVWDSANPVLKKYGSYISQINQVLEARHIILRGLDTPRVGAAVLGADPAGNMSAFPQDQFAQFFAPFPNNFQSGGIYTTGDGYFNSRGQFGGFRVTGIGSFPSGSGPGFEIYRQNGDGFLFPFDRTTSVIGNVFCPGGVNFLQGVTATPASFNTTGIYSSNSVQGNQGVFTGGFSPANVPALHCGFFMGGGWMESFMVNGGATYFPTILNGSAIKPVLVWTSTDNGKGPLQVNGSATMFHLIGTTSAPASSALGTNVTSVTFDPTANDMGWTMTVVTSGAVSGTICNIAPNSVYQGVPHPIISNADQTTANGTSAIWLTAVSTNQFTFGGTISGAGTYNFTVNVIQ